MSKKYRQSPTDKIFDELVEMSSVLPWWVSVGMAILLFLLVLFSLSATGNVFDTSHISVMFLQIIFGVIFKYVIPLALILGGLKNLFQRGKSAWMFSSITEKGAKETLRDLNWKDFEFLISEYFKKQDYKVDLINARGADGGIDIKLYKNNELYLVQCKYYKAWKVSVQIVRELYGLMSAENAAGGYVVTTGQFTSDAIAFALNKEIELIDGNTLEKILDGNLLEHTTSTLVENNGKNICPRCGNTLLLRTSVRGKFWGCSSFPKCRYTSDLK